MASAIVISVGGSSSAFHSKNSHLADPKAPSEEAPKTASSIDESKKIEDSSKGRLKTSLYTDAEERERYAQARAITIRDTSAFRFVPIPGRVGVSKILSGRIVLSQERGRFYADLTLFKRIVSATGKARYTTLQTLQIHCITNDELSERIVVDENLCPLIVNAQIVSSVGVMAFPPSCVLCLVSSIDLLVRELVSEGAELEGEDSLLGVAQSANNCILQKLESDKSLRVEDQEAPLPLTIALST